MLIHDLAFLASETEGRCNRYTSNLLAQQYIAKDSIHWVCLKQKAPICSLFAFSNTNGTNVVEHYKGTKYLTVMLLSAHYDHLGNRNGKIYYGADDDASSTACVLALAKYFIQHPPLHSLVLATFDAEERGIWDQSIM